MLSEVSKESRSKMRSMTAKAVLYDILDETSAMTTKPIRLRSSEMGFVSRGFFAATAALVSIARP